SSSSTTAATVSKGIGGASFWSRARTARTSGGKRSGSMLAAWPSFIAAPFRSPRVCTSFSAVPRERLLGSDPVSRRTPRERASLPSWAPRPASLRSRASRVDGGPSGSLAMRSGGDNARRLRLRCPRDSASEASMSSGRGTVLRRPEMARSGAESGPESWGRYPRVSQAALPLAWADDPLPGGAPVLAYGMGRSYGDSCLNSEGPVLLTRRLRRFISFDAQAGVLRAEAGTSLGEVTELVLGKGWLPPVLPGTQFVTLGGAVANDIHGKNHHRAGSFGRHVRAIGLRRSDGSVHALHPGDPLFEATVAGLGLTGLITWVEIGLEPVPSGWVASEGIRFRSLEEGEALGDASPH